MAPKNKHKARADSLGRLKRRLEQLRTQPARRAEIAVKKCGLHLLRSSLEIVPYDEGDLYRSGRVSQTGTGFNTVIYVGFGTDYGLYVHEDLNAAHGEEFNIKYAQEIASGREHPRRPDEQAKFLEYPFRRDQAEYRKIIAAEMVKK